MESKSDDADRANSGVGTGAGWVHNANCCFK